MEENIDGIQMSIFDDIVPEFKVTKPIRLIEFFAGIGAQAKALEVLGVPFEHYRICEWAYNSICSYNAIHLKDFQDYSIGLSKDDMINAIRGISVNYNEPLSDKQLARKPLSWVRSAYNNCKATHNLINIMNVHSCDLGIVEKDKYSYLLSYSFPCQDLSLAGKRAGMAVSQADGGTRSGLLWEVERILCELHELGGASSMPDILVMENVPEVVGSANIKHFQKWRAKLEELGYSNFDMILNAKDYGIPQNRRRCFMVSIFGDYQYHFPMKMKLSNHLEDLEEQDVPEKYFLTRKQLEYVTGVNYHNDNFNRAKMFSSKLSKVHKSGVAGTITTKEGSRACDTFVMSGGGYSYHG